MKKIMNLTFNFFLLAFYLINLPTTTLAENFDDIANSGSILKLDKFNLRQSVMEDFKAGKLNKLAIKSPHYNAYTKLLKREALVLQEIPSALKKYKHLKMYEGAINSMLGEGVKPSQKAIDNMNQAKNFLENKKNQHKQLLEQIRKKRNKLVNSLIPLFKKRQKRLSLLALKQGQVNKKNARIAANKGFSRLMGKVSSNIPMLKNVANLSPQVRLLGLALNVAVIQKVTQGATNHSGLELNGIGSIAASLYISDNRDDSDVEYLNSSVNAFEIGANQL